MVAPTPIRRLRELVDALVWYCRTRPDAGPYLVGAGLGVILTMWLSVSWGALGPLLALAVVGSFAVFAGRLLQEIRSLDAEARAGVELDAAESPWLAQLVEEEPSEPGEKPAAPRASAADDAPSPPAAEPALATPSSLGDTERLCYELREVAAGVPLALRKASSFLEASDLAFELIEAEDPAELEIARVSGEEREIVWTYRRCESALERGRAQGEELLGFDAAG